MRTLLAFLFVISLATSTLGQRVQIPVPAQAEEPHYPVAVRWWGQGMVSIETWWNLTVVIDPYGENIGYELPDISGDLVLVTHEHGDHNNVAAVKGDPVVRRGLDKDGSVGEIHACFDRFENEAKPEWWVNTKADSDKQTDHSLFVRAIPAWHDNSEGSERGAVAMFKIVVDGVTIVHAGDLGQLKLTDEQVKQLGAVDVLLLPVGGVYTIDGDQAWDIVEQVKPRVVVPIHYKTDKLKIPLEPVDKFVEHMPEGWKLDKPTHNTLAIAAAKESGESPAPRLVVLDYKPWQPSAELGQLLDKMYAASQASQKVFAPLSAEQMSWQPPNGTHTPRWNVEHMAGSQLRFFSQIYAAVEPATFQPINLAPKQMPDQYEPAHPEWTGAEEARHMERANAYVRRFAYLLDGLDLEAQAPGGRWKLGQLLAIMERHYGEHTANVQKKFDLEGWPSK